MPFNFRDLAFPTETLNASFDSAYPCFANIRENNTFHIFVSINVSNTESSPTSQSYIRHYRCSIPKFDRQKFAARGFKLRHATPHGCAGKRQNRETGRTSPTDEPTFADSFLTEFRRRQRRRALIGDSVPDAAAAIRRIYPRAPRIFSPSRCPPRLTKRGGKRKRNKKRIPRVFCGEATSIFAARFSLRGTFLFRSLYMHTSDCGGAARCECTCVIHTYTLRFFLRLRPQTVDDGR